jgi:hypothetical protein
MGYRLDNQCLIPDGQEMFLFYIILVPALGLTQPPVEWVPEDIFLAVKQPGCEVDHSPPSSAEVKNGGAIPPLFHVA